MDVVRDGKVSFCDAMFLLSYLFQQKAEPEGRR
jgi:hypothetical protein